MFTLIISAVLALILSISTYVAVGFIASLWANPVFYAFIPLILLEWLLLFVLFLSYFALFIFVSSRFMDKKKPQVKAHRFQQLLLSELGDIFLVFFRIKVVMSKEDKAFFKDFIRNKKTAVLIANHTSNLDMFVLWSVFRKIPLMALSKPEIQELPVVGRYSYYAGNVSINRDNPMQALRGISNSVKMLSQNPTNSFMMFPEGTRSKDGELHEFHAATFIIPEKAKKDIVVLAMQNVDKVNKHKGLITKVYLSVVKVLGRDELENMSSQEMSDTSHSLIKEYLDNHKDRLYK